MSGQVGDADAGQPRSQRRRTPQAGVQSVGSYTVEVGGASIVVTLTGTGVLVEGSEVSAEVLEVPDSPIRLLRLGNAVHELVPHRAEHRGGFVISLGDERVDVEALDERSRAVRSLRAASASPAGADPVRAPMPGLVTRVLVAPGEEVKAGTRLIVMEAMKMENELRAKADGRVKAVPVQAGTAVEKGTLLVEWEG